MEFGRDTREETMVTTLKPHKCAFKWIIKNFTVWRLNVEGIKLSKKFPSGNNEVVQWHLRFYPNENQGKPGCALFVELVTKTDKPDRIKAEITLSLENSEGRTIRQGTFKQEFMLNENTGYTEWISVEKLLEEIKSDDQLVIKCKILVNEEIETDVGKKYLSELLPSSLSNDFTTLVDGGKFGDVTILIDGQRFLAYKGILAARSTVFAAMFDHQMQETLKNTVSISDIDPKVFKELLRYIYTDQLPAVDTMAHELYTAADKYTIPTLKSLCRHHILKKLNWETAAETLILAEMHSDQEMKKHALRFLSGSEAVKVTESGGWKKMLRFHPYLVDETFKALAGRVVGAKK